MTIYAIKNIITKLVIIEEKCKKNGIFLREGGGGWCWMEEGMVCLSNRKATADGARYQVIPRLHDHDILCECILLQDRGDKKKEHLELRCS